MMNGGEQRTTSQLATFASSFVPVARAGWEDVVLAVCTAAPAAFFAFAPLAYATLERDWTSFNELPPSTPAVSAAASSRAVRAGDLATLTGYVVAEALALRAAAPGCAHWSQHAAAAATVLPLLAGSAAAAWSARGVFSGTSRAGVDDGRDVGSKDLRLPPHFSKRPFSTNQPSSNEMWTVTQFEPVCTALITSLHFCRSLRNQSSPALR